MLFVRGSVHALQDEIWQSRWMMTSRFVPSASSVRFHARMEHMVWWRSGENIVRAVPEDLCALWLGSIFGGSRTVGYLKAPSAGVPYSRIIGVSVIVVLCLSLSILHAARISEFGKCAYRIDRPEYSGLFTDAAHERGTDGLDNTGSDDAEDARQRWRSDGTASGGLCASAAAIRPARIATRREYTIHPASAADTGQRAIRIGQHIHSRRTFRRGIRMQSRCFYSASVSSALWSEGRAADLPCRVISPPRGMPTSRYLPVGYFPPRRYVISAGRKTS